MDRLKLPTLLIISENPSVRFWIKKHLQEQFFILEAFDFNSGLEAVKSSSLDFVIIDSDFENCNPLKLSMEIRQNLEISTPILLITGRLKKSFLNAALDSGVTDFISNQLDPEELHLRIATGRKAQTIQERTKGVSGNLTQKARDLSIDYLKNKFLLHDQAVRLIAHAKSEHIPLFALFIRIDRFEEMQTKLGFLVASEILLPLSNLLSRLIPESDLLIPMGEGRFIVLLQNATKTSAKTIAENFRSEIKNATFQTKNGPVHLSVSMTLSSMEASEGDFNRMIEVSLQALKEAHTAANLIIPLEC